MNTYGNAKWLHEEIREEKEREEYLNDDRGNVFYN
jgi:hypothetical protein